MPKMSRVKNLASPEAAFREVHDVRYEAFLALQNAARAIRSNTHS